MAQDSLVYPAPLGALTQLLAGTMPETAKYNGEVRNQRGIVIVYL